MELQLSISEAIAFGLFAVGALVGAYQLGTWRGRDAGEAAAEARIDELEDAHVRLHLEVASWRRRAVVLADQLERSWTRRARATQAKR